MILEPTICCQDAGSASTDWTDAMSARALKLVSGACVLLEVRDERKLSLSALKFVRTTDATVSSLTSKYSILYYLFRLGRKYLGS